MVALAGSSVIVIDLVGDDMKLRYALALIIMPAAPAIAGTMSPAAVRSPLIGRWAVDTARLTMPSQARPTSVTIAFADAGQRHWTMQVDIVAPDGSKRHSSGRYALDGTPGDVAGDTSEADTAAISLPAPDVLVVGLGRGGAPAATRVYAVAPDGRTMVETATYIADDGKPFMRTNYFRRIR